MVLYQFIFFIILGAISQWGLVSGLRTEVISEDPKYIVSWEISGKGQNATVTFDLTVETTGYVGFGISKSGGMAHADIIIGGVNPDRSAYFSDRHGGTENAYPLEDAHQDWILLSAAENATHTMLKFSRLLDTCDDEDLPILLQTQRFIYAVGATDDISYHQTKRGAFSVSILGEAYPDVDLSHFDTFDAVMNLTMPSKETTYWCTVHKAPIFNGKQHAVAFSSVLGDLVSKQHTHHLSLYACKAPNGRDPQEFFDRYIVQGGIDCLDREPGQISAYAYCTTLIYTWTIGGRIMYMPEDVGFPLGEEEHMYYLMESHLDNPQSLSNVYFESGVRIYYSDELRPIEAGVMRTGQMYSYNFVVPPNSQDYLVVGHCSSNCSSQHVPSDGVDIFNIMLHSHAFGRKMKLRQFRAGTELPWIINDENYDNNYQDNRNVPLTKFLAGDHLSIECNYNNSFLSPPGTVIGGFGTREEMCEVVFYYYPRVEGWENCRSESSKKIVLDYFGIESVKDGSDSSTNPIITAPEQLAGLTFLEHLDSLNWTDADRNVLEELIRNSMHIEQCGGDGFQKSLSSEPNEVYYVTYPEIDIEYIPPATDCPLNPFGL